MNDYRDILDDFRVPAYHWEYKVLLAERWPANEN